MISVILCTHNPRRQFLLRTLGALREQTLSPSEWEFVVVDNASDPPIDGLVDVVWHPNARVVREDMLGLTPARLRGINEASGDVLLFVDDDNVLDEDYLGVAGKIASTWPVLGAWGGQIVPEFESPPEPWAEPYLSMLALRRVSRPLWGNLLDESSHTPWGAGLCVRRQIAVAYRDAIEHDPRRRALDRRGTSLSSGGDVDMAYTAIDQGLGIGVFPELNLVHLIPTARLSEDYLVRLCEANSHSGVWLGYFRGKVPSLPPARSLVGRLMDRIRFHRLDRRSQRFFEARQRGQRRAIEEVLSWHCGNEAPDR